MKLDNRHKNLGEESRAFYEAGVSQAFGRRAFELMGLTSGDVRSALSEDQEQDKLFRERAIVAHEAAVEAFEAADSMAALKFVMLDAKRGYFGWGVAVEAFEHRIRVFVGTVGDGASGAFFNPDFQGMPVIWMFLLDGMPGEFEPSDLAEALRRNRSHFLHEFIHVQDSDRWKGKSGVLKGYKPHEDDKKSYYNHPAEMNAYYQQGIDAFADYLGRLKNGKVSAAPGEEGAARYAEIVGQSADAFFRDAKSFFEREFMKNLEPGNERKVKARVAMFQQSIPRLRESTRQPWSKLEEGNLKLFHGSPVKGIKKFALGVRISTGDLHGSGLYLTKNFNYAHNYLSANGGSIYEVEVDESRIIDLTKEDVFTAVAKKLEVKPWKYAQDPIKALSNGLRPGGNGKPEDLFAKLKALGYIGVKYSSEENYDMDNYIIFNPSDATIVGEREVAQESRRPWRKTMQHIECKHLHESEKLWYHGRTSSAKEFSFAHIGNGHDLEGPGFYLTSDRTDASSYAYPNGQVATVILNPKRLLSHTKKPKPADVLRLMKMSPDYEGHLSNWDEDPKKAEKAALQAMLNQGSEKEVFIQVWFDFFRYDAAEWAKEMVAMGYDGLQLKREGGVEHFVVYDPSIIRAQSWDPYVSQESKTLRWVRRF